MPVGREPKRSAFLRAAKVSAPQTDGILRFLRDVREPAPATFQSRGHRLICGGIVSLPEVLIIDEIISAPAKKWVTV